MDELSVSLDEIKNNSQLKIIDHNETEKIADPLSIDFEPTTVAEASKFMDLLVEESLLRDMDVLNTREELQSELKIKLGQEEHLRQISARLQHCTQEEGMSFVLIQWIPCILHIENCIGIKIITLLFAEGLSHTKRKTHPLYQQNSQKEREIAFKEKVEEVISCQILGSGFNKWQFQVPLERSKRPGEGTIIGTINFENTKACKIVENMENLID